MYTEEQMIELSILGMDYLLASTGKEKLVAAQAIYAYNRSMCGVSECNYTHNTGESVLAYAISLV